jgi:diaminopimelate epimerase
VRLTKHHGLGNDFLVALSSANEGLAPDAAVAVALCNRHRGIGADGLIYGLADTAGPITMVLLNSDGSRAEISGNGIRCFAQAILRAGGRAAGEVTVETDGGSRRLVATATEDPAVMSVTAEMGAVVDGPAVPSDLGVPVVAAVGLGIGNPHLVLQVTDLDAVDPAVDGRRIEALVPGGVNVHFLVPDGPDRIRLTHWERGAGVTEACGSGAAVSAEAARRWGLVSDRVEVEMPGGSAVVRLGPMVRLTGAAAFIGEVIIP